MTPNTGGGNVDWRKKPLACSPVIKPATGASVLNCSSCLLLSTGVMIQGSVIGDTSITSEWTIYLLKNNISL